MGLVTIEIDVTIHELPYYGKKNLSPWSFFAILTVAFFTTIFAKIRDMDCEEKGTFLKSWSFPFKIDKVYYILYGTDILLPF